MNKNQPLDLMKDIIGELPLTAELYWYLRQAGSPPPGSFSLKKLRKYLETWKEESPYPKTINHKSKKVFLFARFGKWISHTTLTGLVLASLGHEVYLGFLPFSKRKKIESKFDLRRQNLYIKNTLKVTEPWLNTIAFWNKKSNLNIPLELKRSIEETTLQDVQYILMREDVNKESDLYKLRLNRNLEFAKNVLKWLKDKQPDVIILPNGNNLEFGVLFHVGRHLDIPLVTYEFGEQKERTWLAQNGNVMRQATDQLWDAYQDKPLNKQEWRRIKTLYSARRGADLWKNFSRQWQKTASQGGEKVRSEIGLDQRPIVFLPTNVVGDSLTLGRHIFSNGMSEWLVRTIEYFHEHPNYQLVVRIHPGEQLGWGPSLSDILRDYFEEFRENVHIIPADAKINSYDLIEIASFATVFTTTLGMEIAMSGVPVIVVGTTHYRDKGFTLDPNTWEDYFDLLEKLLKQKIENKLSKEQVEKAWTYAYRFFFDYPFPFPWHIQKLWKSVEEWPLKRVLSKEGLEKFGDTFRYLVGEPIEWQ